MRKEEVTYFFTQKDFDILITKIKDIKNRLLDVGVDMADWCEQSSETYHDNFGFEEGARKQRILYRQLDEYEHLRKNARVLKKGKRAGLDIGKVFWVEDLESGELLTIKIGSYINFDLDNKEDLITVSYEAPMAKILIGSRIGDEVKGNIVSRQKNYKIIEIN